MNIASVEENAGKKTSNKAVKKGKQRSYSIGDLILSDTGAVILVQRAVKGDRTAFDKLCGIKSRKMLFIAYNILGDYHEAEDVVQEAILAMFMNIKKLRSAEAFDGWMS
ncbi:MAG: hypothetical protein LBS67_05945, partial [Clostridiales Family XIII bacterium]|nr:hypothetical protein [Clostridiales Family XIII bacterium]